MAVGIGVLGVDGRRKRLGRLFKQRVFLLLLFLVVLDFQLPPAFDLPAHILQREHIQHNRQEGNGHVVQRNAVHEYLQHGGNDAEAGEQQRNPDVAVQNPAILHDDGQLQDNDRQGHQKADDETRRALVSVHRVKGIVKAGKPGDDDQRHAYQTHNTRDL